MFRYYAIATVIVLTVAVAATAWNYRDRIAPAPQASSQAQRVSPSSSPHGGFEGEPGSGGASLHGDAPWALSALPDCLIQRSESTGPVAYVRSKLPKGATEVRSGTVLHYGPCTISVKDGEAVVSRGSDELRIPPRVTLYRTDAALALLRTSGDHGDLRVYTPPRNSE